ncbi:MAG: hypothetical protein HUJ61_02710 [Bacilli bacterium]|nr:hypothetical protein [Bacilli bacterium]
MRNQYNENDELELKELCDALVSIKDEATCREFLTDWLSTNELKSLSGRVHSALLFMSGKTYNEVIAETKISSATLARVSKCVKHGTGYNKVLRK